MNSERNILLYTKEQIFYIEPNESEQNVFYDKNMDSVKNMDSSQNTDSSQNSDSDTMDVDIFTYDNLCQEYNFKTGEVALYKQRPDELYELLYHSDIGEDFRVTNFYSKNSAFVLKTDISNDKQIYFLDYYPRENFVNFMNSILKYENTKNFLLKKLYPFMCNYGITSNSSRLIENSVLLTDTYNNYALKEYKNLFIKYSCTTAYIPISSILENTIDDINNYIASGNLDLNTLKRRLFELESFKQVCPTSYTLISNFITNPNDTDLRRLSLNLQKNMNNIDNLIHLYMKDELNIQNRGEKDDCK